jgi:hypothetical protein
MRWDRIAISGVLFIALLFLWPNLVHEPLHWLALKVQGSAGTISFDWSLPAHPAITRSLPVDGVAGGLIFLLLPSLVSIALIIAAMIGHPFLEGAGVVIPVYLCLDLLINIMGYKGTISDFHFMVVVPGAKAIALVSAVIIMLCAAIIVVREHDHYEGEGVPHEDDRKEEIHRDKNVQ